MAKAAKPTNDPYPPLFEQYRKELRAIYDTLVKERDRVVKETMDESGVSKKVALKRFEDDNGPLVHDGRVIHIIRKYWLEIDRLKKERMARDEAFLEPLTFLVEDLEDEEEEELVDFLTEIAYWPVGLDENNEWT